MPALKRKEAGEKGHSRQKHFSPARGNVTGNSGLGTELNTKRLEVLKDAVPRFARVGFLRPGASTSLQLKEIRPAALALRLKLELIDTQPDPKGLESAFQTAKQKQVNAIMTMSTPTFFAERKRIVELAGKYRLPAIYPDRERIRAGGRSQGRSLPRLGAQWQNQTKDL